MKKIPTMFVRVFEKNRIIGITEEFTNEKCREALEKGIPTIKVDGSCCAIINGVFYKRYDAKKGKPIPEGAIPCQEDPDPITGHFPCWIECDKNNPADKWFWSAYGYSSAYHKIEDGTYEAYGKHFNGNPYSIDYDRLYKHGDLFVTNLERTFEGVKHWLEGAPEEGIVFWLDNEPVCKIKRSDFGFEWPIKEGSSL